MRFLHVVELGVADEAVERAQGEAVMDRRDLDVAHLVAIVAGRLLERRGTRLGRSLR